MSNYRAASRYAKSLLELSEEQGVLADVLKDMEHFISVCEENRDFTLMLRNPIVKHDMKYKILKKIFEKSVNKLTMAIFEIISRKNRESILPDIAREFQKQYNVYKGIEEASVTTAVPLTPALKKEFEDIVKQLSSKETVQLEEQVDKELIGGYVLKVGDRQLDDSIKSKIKALEVKFKQNPYIKEI